MKRKERVLGLGLKKSGANIGFESESESVKGSGGLKTDDIRKRDFQSDDSSIFHSFNLNLNLSLQLFIRVLDLDSTVLDRAPSWLYSNRTCVLLRRG